MTAYAVYSPEHLVQSLHEGIKVQDTAKFLDEIFGCQLELHVFWKFRKVVPLRHGLELACRYLGIGNTEGYARLRAHVRTIKFGRRILVPVEELDSLIERAKRTGSLFD